MHQNDTQRSDRRALGVIIVLVAVIVGMGWGFSQNDPSSTPYLLCKPEPIPTRSSDPLDYPYEMSRSTSVLIGQVSHVTAATPITAFSNEPVAIYTVEVLRGRSDEKRRTVTVQQPHLVAMDCPVAHLNETLSVGQIALFLLDDRWTPAILLNGERSYVLLGPDADLDSVMATIEAALPTPDATPLS